MKRRSFIALVLACLGIKLVPKTKAWEEIYDTSYHEWPSGTLKMLDANFRSVDSVNPPVYLTEIMEQDVVRMDQMGEYARDQLAKQLWYDIRRTDFNELV